MNRMQDYEWYAKTVSKATLKMQTNKKIMQRKMFKMQEQRKLY